MVQGQGYVGRAQLGPGEEGDRGSPEQMPAEGLAGRAAAAGVGAGSWRETLGSAGGESRGRG